mmetsp:Transcript_12198/g.25858  ORF Transcript_12198/g.25858 Transcript_12198/m.25858 type:complete len:85 (-) Transcript_12198:211-465(-)
MHLWCLVVRLLDLAMALSENEISLKCLTDLLCGDLHLDLPPETDDFLVSDSSERGTREGCSTLTLDASIFIRFFWRWALGLGSV